MLNNGKYYNRRIIINIWERITELVEKHREDLIQEV